MSTINEYQPTHSDLQHLSSSSAASVIIAYVFGLLMGGLALLASAQGVMPAPLWLPDAQVLGTDPVNAMVLVVLTIPVTSLSFVCQMNILPLVRGMLLLLLFGLFLCRGFWFFNACA